MLAACSVGAGKHSGVQLWTGPIRGWVSIMMPVLVISWRTRGMWVPFSSSPHCLFPSLSLLASGSRSFILSSISQCRFISSSILHPGQHNNTQGLDQSPKTAGSLIDAYQRIHCSWSVLSAPTIKCTAVIASLLLRCAVLLGRYCDCSIPHNLQMKPPVLDSPDRPSWHSIIYTSVMWFQIFHDDPWSKNSGERGKKCSTNTKQQNENSL